MHGLMVIMLLGTVNESYSSFYESYLPSRPSWQTIQRYVPWTLGGAGIGGAVGYGAGQWMGHDNPWQSAFVAAAALAGLAAGGYHYFKPMTEDEKIAWVLEKYPNGVHQNEQGLLVLSNTTDLKFVRDVAKGLGINLTKDQKIDLNLGYTQKVFDQIVQRNKKDNITKEQQQWQQQWQQWQQQWQQQQQVAAQEQQQWQAAVQTMEEQEQAREQRKRDMLEDLRRRADEDDINLVKNYMNQVMYDPERLYFSVVKVRRLINRAYTREHLKAIVDNYDSTLNDYGLQDIKNAQNNELSPTNFDDALGLIKNLQKQGNIYGLKEYMFYDLPYDLPKGKERDLINDMIALFGYGKVIALLAQVENEKQFYASDLATKLAKYNKSTINFLKYLIKFEGSGSTTWHEPFIDDTVIDTFRTSIPSENYAQVLINALFDLEILKYDEEGKFAFNFGRLKDTTGAMKLISKTINPGDYSRNFDKINDMKRKIIEHGPSSLNPYSKKHIQQLINYQLDGILAPHMRGLGARKK